MYFNPSCLNYSYSTISYYYLPISCPKYSKSEPLKLSIHFHYWVIFFSYYIQLNREYKHKHKFVFVYICIIYLAFEIL